MQRAAELLIEAGKLREGQDDQEGSIRLLEEALRRFTQNQDYEGICNVYRSLFLDYKHLYFKTMHEKFRAKAMEVMSSSLDVAKENNLKHLIGRGHFGLGEAEMLYSNYEKAGAQYQMALDTYSGTRTELGDYRYHLGEALYRSGKKGEGKATLLEGLQEIETHRHEVDSFLANVWESGCHMKLATLLKDDSSQEAMTHLRAAKRIIDSDPRLTIRARQIAELESQFEQREEANK